MTFSRLFVEADSQTDSAITRQSPGVSRVQDERKEVNYELLKIHMSLISRINELELQNAEILDTVNGLAKSFRELKNILDRRNQQDKDSDLLMRNVGILS